MHVLKKYSVLFASIGIAGLVVVVGLVLGSGGGANTPITWTPSLLNEAVPAGTSHTATASFVSLQNFNDIQVRIEPPALQPFVQVTPASFAAIAAGQTYSLSIVLSAPATTTPTTINGKIKLVSGQTTLAWRLPIAVSVIEWVQHNEEGVLFRSPTDWNVDVFPQTSEEEGTVAIHGLGGSKILILPSGGFPYDIDPEIDLSEQPIVISGYSAIRADYRDPVTGELLLVRVVFSPPIPQAPDLRVEFHPNFTGSSEEETFARILQTLIVQ